MARRFVCIRQVDVSDCGAAALATIARYFGMSIGLQTMRELAGTDRSGAQHLGLVAQPTASPGRRSLWQILGRLLTRLKRIASVKLTMQDAPVALDRPFQALDMDAEQLDERQNKLPRVQRGIELRGVSFRYGGLDNVLEDLTLHIPAGAKVAIVGESGCGKSTLLKLLMRFYDPTEGQVVVDGVDLRDYDLADFRSRIGLVSQEPFIFTGTIRDNIAQGSQHVDRGRIAQAARAAGLEAFITGLPDRYDTIVGERGANLSGGQRQRLAIARAFLRSPEILVFDEATSRLDPTTELAIQENLRGELGQRTVVLVAHRLSTVRDADVIYVMHEGRIVESGTHEILLRNDGRYAELWRSQTTGNGHSAVPIAVTNHPAWRDGSYQQSAFCDY